MGCDVVVGVMCRCVDVVLPASGGGHQRSHINF